MQAERNSRGRVVGLGFSVARDPAGPCADVPVGQLWDFHLRTSSNGKTFEAVFEPMLAARAWCVDVPELPHGGAHGRPCPHPLVVLIPEQGGEAYAVARGLGEQVGVLTFKSHRKRRTLRESQARERAVLGTLLGDRGEGS
jgi:hypothetical protein